MTWPGVPVPAGNERTVLIESVPDATTPFTVPEVTEAVQLNVAPGTFEMGA